jgi:hypothetical protein
MGEGNRGNDKTPCPRTLEPIARDSHFGQPSCYRVRRGEESAPKQPSRLLFLPPVWARASFWLPLRPFAPAPRSSEPTGTDPRDDFAA